MFRVVKLAVKYANTKKERSAAPTQSIFLLNGAVWLSPDYAVIILKKIHSDNT